jgi:hypothetical protein
MAAALYLLSEQGNRQCFVWKQRQCTRTTGDLEMERRLTGKNHTNLKAIVKESMVGSRCLLIYST